MPRGNRRDRRAGTRYVRNGASRTRPATNSVAAERRAVLTSSDVRRVFERFIESELVRAVGHVWPFLLFSNDRATSMSGSHLRTPHPLQFTPEMTTARYHSLEHHRIYQTFRVLAYGLGFELEFCNLC